MHDLKITPVFLRNREKRSIAAYELDLERLRWLRQRRSTRAFLSDESRTAIQKPFSKPVSFRDPTEAHESAI